MPPWIYVKRNSKIPPFHALTWRVNAGSLQGTAGCCIFKMKTKKYTLEEKVEFFTKYHWGEESDYKGFYRDGVGGFPEQEIVINLTNDELIHKYLEWVDSHVGDEWEVKYGGKGYAIHYAFEMGRRLRKGIKNFEPRQETDSDWIAFSKNQGWFQNDFVPFRYFETIIHDQKGDIFGHWCTWIVSNGKLQKLTPSGEEKISDWIILGNVDDEGGIIGRLNTREEIDYGKRLKSIPLSSLRHQRGLWEELQFNNPMKTSNLGIELEYKPIEILNREIQERMLDSIPEKEKHRRAVNNNSDELIREPLKDKCKKECELRKLPKYKMITRQGKYDIALSIGLEKIPKFARFKSGNKAYHRISKMLSELGYSNKPKRPS